MERPGRHDVSALIKSSWLCARTALVVAAVASFLFVACSTAVQSATRGSDAAPDFELEVFANENYTGGELVSLSGFEGQPVIVNFWYPSCPPCRLEMPDLEATFQKYKDDGLQFIGVMAIVLDTVEEGQQFIDEFGITYAVGPDVASKIIIDFNVTTFPTTVFLNKNHEIVRPWAGVLTEEKLEELIGPLLQ